jgi:hypothetical protein
LLAVFLSCPFMDPLSPILNRPDHHVQIALNRLRFVLPQTLSRSEREMHHLTLVTQDRDDEPIRTCREIDGLPHDIAATQ